MGGCRLQRQRLGLLNEGERGGSGSGWAGSPGIRSLLRRLPELRPHDARLYGAALELLTVKWRIQKQQQ